MKIILSMTALFVAYAALAQNTPADLTVSEDNLIGKTYKAEVVTKYGKTVGGGFTDTKYCYFQFEKNSVKITQVQLYISYRDGKETEPDKSESKTYHWRLHNEEIIIENFNDYGHLIFRNNQIVGKDPFGSDLIFCIETDTTYNIEK